MVKFIIKRLVFALISIWLVATFTFVLMHMLPGDPFDSGKAASTQVKENLRARYGLDKPLFEQYGVYMSNLARLDLGLSMVYQGKSVNSVIERTFPVSLSLGVGAFMMALVLGLVVGVLSAVYRDRFVDYAGTVLAVVLVSVPVFIIGTFTQYFICYRLSSFIQDVTNSEGRLLPLYGWGGIREMLAPTFTLFAATVGVVIRMTRASTVGVMEQNYIMAARAKGLNKREIVGRHVLRNALLPVLAMTGPIFASVILGSFAVENIFSIPGLGKYFLDSVRAKDYTMVTGLSVFTSAVIISVNTFTDLLHSLINPQVRLYGHGD